MVLHRDKCECAGRDLELMGMSCATCGGTGRLMVVVNGRDDGTTKCFPCDGTGREKPSC